LLADTLVDTVAAMAGPYDRLATEASGGLDSSIVNAAIGRAGLTDRLVAALHYVGDRREADERRWAQALAERWGLPLACLERPKGGLDPETDFAGLSRDIRPPLEALDSARDRDAAERLQTVGAQALVTGKGGDAVFFQMPTPQVLADLWRARGIAAARDPLNAEVARWLRRSVWSAWREALLTGPPAPAPPLRRFAGPALREAAPTAPHPWLADLAELPPAKHPAARRR
jgi:asparagine synthase (glutamine-hydrolysing)